LQHFTGHYYVLFSDTGSVAVLHTICTIFRRAITAQVWQILKILLPWNFDVVFMISKSNKRFDFQTRVTNLLNCLTLQELLKDASIFISKSKKYLFCCGRYPSSATFASTDWSVLTILTGIIGCPPLSLWWCKSRIRQNYLRRLLLLKPARH